MKNIEINLPAFDRTEPNAWAECSAIHIAWLRQACPQLGLDTKRIIIGDVLDTITGDDLNCFGHSYILGNIGTEQRDLQIRMDIEITTPEIPDDIRQKLSAAKAHIFAINWKSESGWELARNTWLAEVRDFVNQQVSSNKELSDIVEDYRADQLSLMPQWRKFLKRRP
jgi:hypothetical protein